MNLLLTDIDPYHDGVMKHLPDLSHLSSSPVKTKPPTIVSVRESNGNFQVNWDPNLEAGFRDSLTANVTYHKKGDTEKVGAVSYPLRSFDI